MFPTLRPALLLLTTLASTGALTACSNGQEARTVDAAPGNAAACDASRADSVIGQNLSGYVEREATRLAGASSSRVLGPDDMATMDLDPRRLNIHVDPGKVIIKLACG